MKKKSVVIALIFFLTFGFESNGLSQWMRTNGSVDSAVESLVASGSSLLAGTRNGIYRSTNNGDDWTQVSTGLPRTSIQSLVKMESDFFAASRDSSGCSAIFRSIDDGRTWLQVCKNIPSPYVCTGVMTLFVKDTLLFAGAACGGVFLSTDRGYDWITIDSGIQAQPYVQASALGASPTNLFVKTDIGECSFGAATTIFRSTNNGTVWSHASDSIPRNDMFEGTAFALLGSNFFAGMYHTIYLWTDSNSRWSRVGTLPTFGRIQSLIVRGTNIFAALDGPKTDRLFLSTDSAKTWRSVSTGLENASIYSNPYQLTVNDQYLFVGIIDKGVWRRPLSEFGFSSVNTPTPTDFAISLSPNPTAGIVTVRNASDNIFDVTLTNLFGETVLKLSHPNTPDFMLDLSKLPPSTYFAKFLCNGSVVTRKIVKQ